MINKEDYEEQQCLLCMKDKEQAKIESIPTSRVIEKLDEYYDRNDYDGAKRHLDYWLKEAVIGNDKKGELTVRNELLGFYRKQNMEEEAIDDVSHCVRLISELGIENEMFSGIIYVNIGTVYKVFNNLPESMKYFTMAEKIYIEKLEENDERLSALYNNMGLTLLDLRKYDEAKKSFSKAIDILKRKGLRLDRAISILNLANVIENEMGIENCQEETNKLLDEAYNLISGGPELSEGYYAYVCDKCAPTFGYFGFFLIEKELKEKAKKFYERA